MKYLTKCLNRVSRNFFSKSISRIPLEHFFDKNFEKNKNNMKEVVSKFQTLNLQEKLHLKSHFISELENEKQIYQNSKAINWLLKENNVSKLITDAFQECENLELKQLSEIMNISRQNPNDFVVKRVITKMKELLPFVRDHEDLEWVLKTVHSVKSAPSSKWTTSESIFDFREIEDLEKSTRSQRTPNQNVEMFTLIKEFDLSTLSDLEIGLLHQIIENIQGVDPGLYLKLTLDLLSHFLFEFSSKRINGEKINHLLDSVSLSDLKKEIPTLELVEKLAESNYNPQRFCSTKLMETVSLFKPLTSLACLSFYDLFPKLADQIASIGKANIKKNLPKRSVTDQIYKIPTLQKIPDLANMELMMTNFTDHVRQHLEVQRKFEDVFEKEQIPIFRGDISENLLKFKDDIDLDTKTFRTPVTRLVEDRQYSDLLKLALFFESCFHYSFPIFYYFSQYFEGDPSNQIFQSFYDFSLDLLIYLCKMGRALVKKINEFDLNEHISQIEHTFQENPVQMEKEILRVLKYEENNQEVLNLILKTLNSKLRHVHQINKNLQIQILIDNMQKLKNLIK